MTKLHPLDENIYNKKGEYRNFDDYKLTDEPVSLVMKNKKTGHQITTRFGKGMPRGLVKQLSLDATRHFINNNKEKN